MLETGSKLCLQHRRHWEFM